MHRPECNTGKTGLVLDWYRLNTIRRLKKILQINYLYIYKFICCLLGACTYIRNWFTDYLIDLILRNILYKSPIDVKTLERQTVTFNILPLVLKKIFAFILEKILRFRRKRVDNWNCVVYLIIEYPGLVRSYLMSCLISIES